MEPLLDDATVRSFLPTTRKVLIHIAAIAVMSLTAGPLLGLYVFGEVRGERLTLSLGTALGWGLSFAFVAAFVYTAWIISRAWKAYHKHMAALKMEAFYRAVEGGQRKD